MLFAYFATEQTYIDIYTINRKLFTLKMMNINALQKPLYPRETPTKPELSD